MGLVIQELFKFLSGTYGLNEELGSIEVYREGKLQCALCGAECESMVDVLWECSAYKYRGNGSKFQLVQS